MRTAGIIIGILIALAGVVWIGQGLNMPWAPASFMTSDRTWVVIGAGAVLGGGGLAIGAWRRPAR